MRFSILGCLLLLGAGCSVVNDTGGFEEDLGCDGTLSIVNFQPHETHRFEARFVQRRSNDAGEPGFNQADVVSLAYIEPLRVPTATLFLPDAIAPLEDPSVPRAQIDFYADVDRDGQASGPDHSWTINDACVGGLTEFAHNIRFNPLPELIPRDLSATLVFCGERGTGMNPPPVEFRATSSVPDHEGGETNRVTGFYRYDVDREPELAITLPRFLDASLATTFEAYVDTNDNGLLDNGETGFRWQYDFGSVVNCGPRALAQLCNDSVPREEAGLVCLDASDPLDQRLVMAMGPMGEPITQLQSNQRFLFRE